jgi:ABC-type lipoprotein export system ATPase subunit
MIKVQNLHKVYNNAGKRLHVLKGLNLELKEREFVCIIGPSGAGKSTFLHLLGGLDFPTEGRILIDGLDLSKLNDIHLAHLRNKKMGFVFQFYNLIEELTAWENVALPGVISGRKLRQARERSIDILTHLGLRERLNHRPCQLSGGEQQRVAIARALFNEPQFLFCDEPTGNLDSQTGQEICALLESLNRHQQKTLVIVTHEESLSRRAGRVLHIKDGQFV